MATPPKPPAPRRPAPERDPAYAPNRREEDQGMYWVEVIARLLRWPLVVVFLTLVIGLAGVRVVYGEQAARDVLEFMAGPGAIGIIAFLGALLTTAVTVALRRVPQVSRFERRQAATQSELQDTREEFKEDLSAVMTLLEQLAANPGAGPTAAADLPRLIQTAVTDALAAQAQRFDDALDDVEELVVRAEARAARGIVTGSQGAVAAPAPSMPAAQPASAWQPAQPTVWPGGSRTSSSATGAPMDDRTGPLPTFDQLMQARPDTYEPPRRRQRSSEPPG